MMVGAAASMLNAINDAQLTPKAIDYINAHGTSTQAGDLAKPMPLKPCLLSMRTIKNELDEIHDWTFVSGRGS